MKAIVVEKAGSDFTLSERQLTEPGEGAVRLKVAACGICHGDVLVKEGYWPGIAYPRIPGHEVAGTIDAVGPGVSGWEAGMRVGVGWHGGHCGVCDPCRRGDVLGCARGRITGISFDGGYAQYMIVSALALARLPDALSFAEAAPLLCAGMTTYNGLRYSGAVPGDLVAVQGIGGLGHLGVQFARHAGFHTVAISRGRDKEELALKLGAHRYLDGDAVDVPAELMKMGGAKVILATAPNSRAISPLVDGLGADGTLMIVGASPEPLAISPGQLIHNRRSVRGWASGSSKDSEDTLAFCALNGIRPMIEQFPLAEAAHAYQRMMTNQVRFRSVLVCD